LSSETIKKPRSIAAGLFASSTASGPPFAPDAAEEVSVGAAFGYGAEVRRRTARCKFNCAALNTMYLPVGSSELQNIA
jgi:hypothetical protein